MNSNFINGIMNNVTCRFASVADRCSNDNRLSLKLPNTDLHVNFVIYETENVIKILNKQILDKLDISVEKLLEISLLNTWVKEKPHFMDFESAVGLPLIDDFENIIISNTYSYYGSILILNKEVYDAVRKKLGDFYILPSSVHEVICVPKSCFSKEELLHMVQSANSEWFMTDKERLADDVFEIKNGTICSVFMDDM